MASLAAVAAGILSAVVAVVMARQATKAARATDSATNEIQRLLKRAQSLEGFLRGSLRPGIDLSGTDLSGQDLSHAHLSESRLSRARLTRAVLREADLTSSDLTGCLLVDADLRSARLTGANLFEADLSRARLAGANLDRANLARAVLAQADLSNAELRHANMQEAYLAGADLRGAQLDGAVLTGADLSGALFSSGGLARAHVDDIARKKTASEVPMFFSDHEELMAPVYIALDVSASMAGSPIAAMNHQLANALFELREDPETAERLGVSIIAFSDRAEVVLPLTFLHDVSTPPQLEASGSTQYGPVFELLRDTMGRDIGALKNRNIRVLQPAVLFVSDGSPVDPDWENALDALAQFAPAPVILGFAVGSADPHVMKRIAGRLSFTAQPEVSPIHAIGAALKLMVHSMKASTSESGLADDGFDALRDSDLFRAAAGVFGEQGEGA